MFFSKLQKKMPIPWGKILRSRAVYAMIFTHYSQAYGQITLFTEVPSFMAKVLHVDIKAVSFTTLFLQWDNKHVFRCN